MGCSSSSTATSTNQQINKLLQIDLRKEKAVHKLLLLGPGDSGKSTIVKQLIKLYGTGFKDKERLQYRRNIYENVISAIKALVDASEDYKERVLEGKIYECGTRPESQDSVKFIDEQPTTAKVTPEIAHHIKKLWSDEGIRNTYRCRETFQFPWNAEYLFARLDDIAQPNYVPTFDDLIHTRNRTTGILESNLLIDGNVFKIVDVGGQRNERRKWIHCFEDVTGVIFVGAISDYDQMLLEDESINRMEETLDLFEEICNSHWFMNTPIITFLNKTDIFDSKCKRSLFSKCPAFSSYRGPDPPGKSANGKNEAIDYIRRKFVERDKSTERLIQIRLTCATDTANIADTFHSVKESILNPNHLTPDPAFDDPNMPLRES